MADVVQWTVDQFWAQLQNLKNGIDQIDAGLKSNATQLGALYSTAQRNMDPYRDVALAPLIHRNTVLRIDYLGPIKADFNRAVSAASSALKAAGYTTPTMNGLVYEQPTMGVVFAIAPVAAITIVVAALAAVAIVWRMTQANITRTAAAASIFNDTSTTAAQKIALAKAHQDEMKQEDANARHDGLGGFNLQDLVLPLALLAAIVLLPSILPQRKAAA